MTAIRPPALRPGARIGIFSPSAPAARLFPKRFKRALRQIESMGYEPVISKHCTGLHGSLSGTAADRAEDLNLLLADPSIRAIVAAIGGDASCQLLPLIEWDLLANDPKLLCGYSDVTVLLQSAQTVTNVITYYGPTVMTEFAEFPQMWNLSRTAFHSVITGCPFTLSWSPDIAGPSQDWTDGEDHPQKRAVRDAQRAFALNPSIVEGHIIGGCIESLEHLKGTRYWPNTAGGILVLETSEPKFDPHRLAIQFADYKNMGVWDNISGVLFGQKDWPLGQLELTGNLLAASINNPAIPIIIGLPFGHITPISTIAIGATAILDATALTLRENVPSL